CRARRSPARRAANGRRSRIWRDAAGLPNTDESSFNKLKRGDQSAARPARSPPPLAGEAQAAFRRRLSAQNARAEDRLWSAARREGARAKVSDNIPPPQPSRACGGGSRPRRRTLDGVIACDYRACAAARSTDAAVWPNRIARSSAVRMPPIFGLTTFAFS